MKRFAIDSITSKFYRLTFLNILSNITIPLAGIIDIAVLGNYAGSLYIAGVSLGTILFDYLYWGCNFLRMGTTGTTAIRIGQGDSVGVYLVLIRSLILGLIIGTLLYVFSPWIADFAFSLLAGSDDLKTIGRMYFDYRIWDAPFTMMNFVMVGWFLGKGRSDIVLLLTILSNGMNIFLDYYFIKEYQMTADGVGLASGMSQVLQFILSIVICYRQYKKLIVLSEDSFKSKIIKGLSKYSEFLSILIFNKDLFLRTVILIVTFSLFRSMSAYMGNDELIVNTILLQFMLVFAFFVDGAAFATEAIAGDLYGRGSIRDLDRILRIGISFGLGIAILFIFNLYFFPEFYLGIISKDESIIRLGTKTLPWMFLVLLLGSVAFIYDGLFFGIVQGRALRNSMFLSTLLFFLPPGILSIYLEWNHLLWIALASFMGGRTISLGYSWNRLSRNRSIDLQDS